MKRRILLADDSVTIQKVIELTFMDEDYEVRAVSNGDEAIKLLPGVNPDFVIADVHMPGANGYEVCRQSKQLRPDVPVLLLVGTFEPFDEAQAHAAGADSFLKKPFDSQELLQRVEELLAAKGPASPAPPAELPLSVTEAFPALSAEPAWGNFELEAEPEPLPFTPPAAEPFDREPAFELAAEPAFEVESVESEQVFSLDGNEPSFGLRDDAFTAPDELDLPDVPDVATAPQDRYLPEELPPWPEPEPAFPPVPEPPAAPPAASPAATGAVAGNGGGQLSDEDVDRIARRVVELLGDKAVRDVAWEVIPDMAEVIIRDRLRELEAQVE
jgi:CheY-like chemotaxis protein